MTMYYERVRSFNRIAISVHGIDNRRISGNINVDGRDFKLFFTYDEDIDIDNSIAGLILTMPVINYAYFTKEIYLDFSIDRTSFDMIREFIKINNVETFINSIVRRRYNFFTEAYLPSENDITQKNAQGNTTVAAKSVTQLNTNWITDKQKTMILSSGGKESLLSFGIMNEINSVTYPVFFNESGGHWKTAKVAYDYFRNNIENTHKVWSNVDRFYGFMNNSMNILNRNEIAKKADSYPIQMFIFPVFIFSMLPYVKKYGIGNIILGDEFDDTVYETPYKGIKHYFGVYDQTNDFNITISEYFKKIGIDSDVFSIVYPIFGTLVEKILVNRYPDLFKNQRSCHLCRYEGKTVKPCGECTKCLGILLFVLNAGGNPEDIGYSRKNVTDLKANIEKANMRLDPSELSYLEQKVFEKKNLETHVEGIHILDGEKVPFSLVPDMYRSRIENILRAYSNGYYRLENGKWT
ncbi:MAG: metal-binding protein, partial [Thermoplasmata archaeon]